MAVSTPDSESHAIVFDVIKTKNLVEEIEMLRLLTILIWIALFGVITSGIVLLIRYSRQKTSVGTRKGGHAKNWYG